MMAKATMNLFGSILPTLSSTFLIDTSGSMYTCLNTVREHLSSYLRVHAVDVPNPNRSILFNLIEFNSNIRRWADRSVFWSHASVTLANDWLNALEPKTGTNTLGGLITAFADTLCQQVILITDGIPDQEPQSILNFLQHPDQPKRPCHIFYIRTPETLETEQETVVKFLQDLAALTRGSLTIGHFTKNGVLEGIAPMINYQLEDTTQALLINEVAAAATQVVPLETTVSSEIGSLLIGQDCLARRDKDGYYYRGKILNQINLNQFMVEFGPRFNAGFSESDFQATYLFDIIHYTDAILHKIKIGDYVLAPDGHQGRYVPGEVLDGFERRASCEQGEIRPLLIHFANGKTMTLKRLQEAVWIPPSVYERIKFELAMPSSARQYLQATSVAYPARVLPGYPTPTAVLTNTNSWPFLGLGPQTNATSIVLAPQHIVSASVNSHDVNNLIMSSQKKPESLMTSDELNRRVDEQIRKHWSLLGEQSPPPAPSPSVQFVTSIPPPVPSHNDHHHHHHHRHHANHLSHSASPSPSLSSARKKSVCFNDTSITRRHSVDDLNVSRQPTPLKSCLKSASTSQFEYSTESLNPQIKQTQTDIHHYPARPQSAALTHEVARSASAANSVEFWHNRQLKSAPTSKKLNQTNATVPGGHRRQNLGHLYEKAQAEVKEELYRQQVKRDDFKRQQNEQQTKLIQQRQQKEAAKPDQILDVKRQFRSQVIHRDSQRTQSVENQNTDRLRFKQQQYANRSIDRAQARLLSDSKTNETIERRKNDTAQRLRTEHNRTLTKQMDDLCRGVIARKFHEENTRQYGFMQTRDRRQAELVQDIEQRRIAWSNPGVYS